MDSGSVVLNIIVIVVLAIIPGFFLRVWLNSREKRRQQNERTRKR